MSFTYNQFNIVLCGPNTWLGLGLQTRTIHRKEQPPVPNLLPLIINAGLLLTPLGQLILIAAVPIYFDRDLQKSAPLTTGFQFKAASSSGFVRPFYTLIAEFL